MNTNVRGFTLVEIVLTLGVIAVLGIAAFIVYPMVNDARQGKIDREFLMAASTNIISAFQGSHQFGPNHDTDDSFLSDLQYGGQLAWALPGQLCHPWSDTSKVPYLCNDAFGHPFYWSTMSLGNPDGTLNPFQLQATFSDLSATQCIQLLQNGVHAFGAQQIEIVRSGEQTVCVQPFTDPSKLVAACTSSDFVDQIQIEWDPWGRPYWMSPEYGWCQEP
ncbi:MAG: type II secretion system protein [Rudaea sp.]|uniref:type II secretion system protein n=1 Tax=unclassified Rudaea TaxID=2627037 RepID=UPI0010FA48F8|nr:MULTISPECIES: type II secretion system protein [unclassified Rudaea]MBN8884461.1 type II secretion system protein [Rudaea sp.]